MKLSLVLDWPLLSSWWDLSAQRELWQIYFVVLVFPDTSLGRGSQDFDPLFSEGSCSFLIPKCLSRKVLKVWVYVTTYFTMIFWKIRKHYCFFFSPPWIFICVGEDSIYVCLDKYLYILFLRIATSFLVYYL